MLNALTVPGLFSFTAYRYFLLGWSASHDGFEVPGPEDINLRQCSIPGIHPKEVDARAIARAIGCCIAADI
jgi:hypothetical protein